MSGQHTPTSFGRWDTYAVCDCGSAFEAAFGDAFHVHHSVCPKCGSAGLRRAPVKTLRWVGFGRLTRPSTWGVGCWQERGEPIPTFEAVKATGTKDPASEGGRDE